MQIDLQTKNIINECLDEIDNLKNTSKINRKSTETNILKTFKVHYDLINYLLGDTKEIKELNRIKKDKKYLQKYISAFEVNRDFYFNINDTKNAVKMNINIWLFNLYINNIQEFYKIQSSINTLFISSPHIKENIKIIKEKKSLSDKEKLYMMKYIFAKHLKDIFLFFKYHPLTKKSILTSLSIILYKSLTYNNQVKKHRAKEILETMFYKLDLPTTIRVDKMDKLYIKTKIDNLLIYAYPNSKDIPSLYNFENISEILSKNISKYQNNLQKQQQYENYIKNFILPIQSKTGI